jgi:hypothetical protein
MNQFSQHQQYGTLLYCTTTTFDADDGVICALVVCGGFESGTVYKDDCNQYCIDATDSDSGIT